MNQKEIYKNLQQLVGLKFTRTTRAANMECLKFGILYQKDRKGEEMQVGEFGIHLQCPWRITKGNLLLVGSDDLTEQIDENAEFDPNFNWDVQGGNLRDVRLSAFLKSGDFFVQSVAVDEFGGFELFFNNDVKLTVFPTLSSKSEYCEYWRLIDNRCKESHHFVVGTWGIDEDNI